MVPQQCWYSAWQFAAQFRNCAHKQQAQYINIQKIRAAKEHVQLFGKLYNAAACVSAKLQKVNLFVVRRFASGPTINCDLQ